jgi:hypothetical protein
MGLVAFDRDDAIGLIVDGQQCPAMRTADTAERPRLSQTHAIASI